MIRDTRPLNELSTTELATLLRKQGWACGFQVDEMARLEELIRRAHQAERVQ